MATKIHEQLEPLAVPIAKVVPDPANANTHPEKNIEAIMASLAAFGQRKPIVVRKEGMICEAGNGTLEAAKRLGWDRIAALVVDDDELTAARFAIADNRTAQLASWDYEALGKVLTGLKDKDVDLHALGWDDGDINNLLASDWGPGTPGDNGDGTQYASDPAGEPGGDGFALHIGGPLRELFNAAKASIEDAKGEELGNDEVLAELCRAYLGGAD